MWRLDHPRACCFPVASLFPNPRSWWRPEGLSIDQFVNAAPADWQILQLALGGSHQTWQTLDQIPIDIHPAKMTVRWNGITAMYPGIAVCLLLTTDYVLLMLTTDYLLLTAHYSLLTTHYSLLTTHYSQTDYPLLTTATHYSLLTTGYLLLATYHSLLATYYPGMAAYAVRASVAKYLTRSFFRKHDRGSGRVGFEPSRPQPCTPEPSPQSMWDLKPHCMSYIELPTRNHIAIT